MITSGGALSLVLLNVEEEPMCMLTTVPGSSGATATAGTWREPMASMNLLPVAYIDPGAILWLASDLSRYVTGVALLLGAGASLK